MDTQTIVMTRAEARGLYRDYKKHLHHSTPIDRECMRAYQLLAQGRLIIKALESITAGGVDHRGFPKLAIVTATARTCYLKFGADGSCTMSGVEYPRSNVRPNMISNTVFDFPTDTFPRIRSDRWGSWRAKS